LNKLSVMLIPGFVKELDSSNEVSGYAIDA